MTLNDELKRIYKEGVVPYFKVLQKHLPGGTKENHGTLTSRLKSKPGTSEI
jgi:hypothetical protein